MKIKLKIRRFNPEVSQGPAWTEHCLDLDPTDRVLDALHEVKWKQDGTLALRRSCGHGVCGSDAMRINGKNRLACKVLLRDVAPDITIEPLMGMKVLKDLVVDMSGFFEKYRAIKPFLLNEEVPPAQERRQSPEEQKRYDDTSKCILCAACTTACPSYWADSQYIGPAALVQAHRFLFDSRDKGREERLAILNQKESVWRCRTVFNCVEACPRGIDVTGAIGQIKRALVLNES